MPLYDLSNDSFGPPPPYHVRRRSSRSNNLTVRKSSATLRKPLSLDDGDENNIDGTTSRSLAHELAVALMPEPSVGSKLLAEELGLEFDEGAEGIDEPVRHDENGEPPEVNGLTFADHHQTVQGAETLDSSLTSDVSEEDRHPLDLDPEFDNLSPTRGDVQHEQRRPDQDRMEILSRDLESNSRFIVLLQKIDTDFTVERIASDTIRRINETVRDREGQVRELLEYEREFRKIAGEVGGSEALSCIDHLENLIVEDDASTAATSSPLPPSTSRRTMLETLEEEPTSLPTADSQDWEVDPDRNHLGDDEEEVLLEADTTISKLDFPPPPPLKGPLTPAKTIPQLAHLRALTASFVSSLASCSEQAQVNGANLTEAARKIRSLKNKIGGLYSEWDSIEHSKQRIEKWESGMVDASDMRASATMSSVKRVDGRKVVQEHLRAFELVLADASSKTQAIMAR